MKYYLKSDVQTTNSISLSFEINYNDFTCQLGETGLQVRLKLNLI
jgi:hypothetical protein